MRLMMGSVHNTIHHKPPEKHYDQGLPFSKRKIAEKQAGDHNDSQ